MARPDLPPSHRVSLMLWPVDRSMMVSAPQMYDQRAFSTSCGAVQRRAVPATAD